MSDVHVVILAAGKGTRMKSALPKVLHRVAGAPLIDYVLASANRLSPRTTTVVIGHQADAMRATLSGHPGLTFVVQEPQLGTAHALLAAEPALIGHSGTLVLLSGDVPLLSAKTLETLVGTHREARAATTVLTAMVDHPTGYGRIVRSGEQIARIVEEKDASASERAIREINTGIYALDLRGLFDAVRGIGSENAQKEYYLPDLVSTYRTQGRTVATAAVLDPAEVQGVNSREDLAMVTRALRHAKNGDLMAAGVTLEDPATTYVDPDVQIGADTILHPGVSVEKGSTIGKSCEIHSGARIVASHLGDHVTILNHCLITDCEIAEHVSVGPFAHLRNGTALAARSKIGNFVEVKKSTVGQGSKAMHLAYLGDTVLGRHVNIGAGTITCNYDGVKKHQTTIEDGAFIGSDTQLIAPVTVGEGAYVGTGTTVRENVPAGALAVSAGKQRNIDGWVLARKKRSDNDK